MTRDEFRDWARMMAHRYNHDRATLAGMLGVTVRTFENYRRRGGPHLLGLACARLASGGEVWKRTREQTRRNQS